MMTADFLLEKNANKKTGERLMLPVGPWRSSTLTPTTILLHISEPQLWIKSSQVLHIHITWISSSISWWSISTVVFLHSSSLPSPRKTPITDLCACACLYVHWAGTYAHSQVGTSSVFLLEFTLPRWQVRLYTLHEAHPLTFPSHTLSFPGSWLQRSGVTKANAQHIVVVPS